MLTNCTIIHTEMLDRNIIRFIHANRLVTSNYLFVPCACKFAKQKYIFDKTKTSLKLDFHHRVIPACVPFAQSLDQQEQLTNPTIRRSTNQSIQGLAHATTYCWFASDVTTAMLVVKNKSISLRWEMNSILMQI